MAEGKKPAQASGELEDDIIVVSDEESSACDSKMCKNNPYCLNYLGQEKWENEGAWTRYTSRALMNCGFG